MIILLLMALVLMNFVGGTGEHLTWFKETKEKLIKLKGVNEVYGVFGRWDIVLKVQVNNMDELVDLITDKIRSIPGVQSSETLLMIF
jgi:DNA-binding Lrp family transcriptional regulator